MLRSSVKRVAKGVLWASASGLFSSWGLMRRTLRGRCRVPAPGEVRSILAVRLDLMGDLVFTLPALRALQGMAPGARLTVLVLPYAADLVRGLPFVDRVVTVDVNRWRRPGEWTGGAGLRQLRRALREVRGARYDLCVSFYGRVGAAAALLSGARCLVGYEAEGFRFSFDVGLPGARYRQRRHEAEYCLDLVRALGVSIDGRPPELQVDPVAAARVKGLLADAGVGPKERLVALHPGALNMAAKRWIPDRWAVVADRVQKELRRRVVLVGSDSESPLVESVRQGMSTAPLVLAGKTSVAELVALLARCDLFMGGDSGPLHVASALGVPSVSVYGPTDPGITGPLGGRARVLRADVECAPCYDLRVAPECRRGDLLCMAKVSVDQVFQAVREVAGEEP